MRFVIFVQLNIKGMFGFCFLKLFLRTVFKKTNNIKKVLSKSSFLLFKFSVFVFFMFFFF